MHVMWMWWGPFGGPWSWLWPVGMMVFWALVLGGLFVAARAWWVHTSTRDPQPALSIVEQRYARGEISREEYQALRQDLTGRCRS
jgi:putative membrane protein